MTQVQLQQLQKHLWNIANDLRGKMGADEFRDYILGFIFYKYLSEKAIAFANELLKDEGVAEQYQQLDESNPDHAELINGIKENSVEEVGYALAPKQLFHSIAELGRQGTFILDDLSDTLRGIERSTLGAESEDDFANLFEDLDLNSTKLGNNANDRNELVSKVLQGKDRLRSVYDPTCGSGSLLLRVKREVKDVDMIYGQEMNRTTYNLARMNMILHDVHFAKFDIKQEDTLTRPQHIDQRFEAVVANPPFSAKWSADPSFLQDERFSRFGKLAPSSKADMAFVQHMLHQLDEQGTMAVVLPHGVLFRGSSEGVIRQYLIEKMNVVDTIIGLPANIFYGTSIPTCILVLKKKRTHTGNILFIDASTDFEKQKNQNKLLPEHLDKIIAAFEQRQDIEKYAKVATLQEVKDNDYNLNIPRYVDTFEAEDEIDLNAIAQQLKELEQQSQKTDEVIADFCKELGIDSPFAEVK